jgi:ribosome maturation factor RimP
MHIEAVKKVVEEWMEGTSFFLVDLSISKDNDINIEFESEDSDIDIEDCVNLSKHIESKFDREVEDYSLEVGSAGIGQPFKVQKQYEVNTGSEVEVITRDGKKLKGILLNADNEGFGLQVETKEKPEGSKRPVKTMVLKMFKYPDVKSVKTVIHFD